MPEIPYIRWRWAEWSAGRISKRPALEQALFVNLQAAMCQAGGPVAVGRPQLIDLADRLRVTVAQVVEALASLVEMELLTQTDDLYMIEFLREEFERVTRVSDVRKQAGERGGRPNKAIASESKAIAFQGSENPAKSADSADVSAIEAESNGMQLFSDGDQTKANAFSSEPIAADSKAKKSSLLENKKEKENNTPLTPRSGAGDVLNSALNVISAGMVIPSEPFRRYTDLHPKKTHYRRAAKAWNDAVLAGHDPEVMIAGLATSPRITGASSPDKVVNPEQYLLDCCWEDQPTATPEPPPAPETGRRRFF